MPLGIKPGRCSIMGVMNVTPDSISDDGNSNTLDAALYQAQKLQKEGTDILFIRPRAQPVKVSRKV